ncbi:uncharacterized protein [Spinacia oleracea]|uniref:Uncharacterized protein n=1 Tax=Spinacia oleracea TaxID=3562 RepID=A0ABM3RLG1_SPIOL|nr:uncharacterized protein LOC130470394 [Spinacia oleracea]
MDKDAAEGSRRRLQLDQVVDNELDEDVLGEQCDLCNDEDVDEDEYKDVDEEDVDDECGYEYEIVDDYDEELDAGDDLDEEIFIGNDGALNEGNDEIVGADLDDEFVGEDARGEEVYTSGGEDVGNGIGIGSGLKGNISGVYTTPTRKEDRRSCYSHPCCWNEFF